MYFSRACIVRVLPSKIIRDMDFSRMGKYHTQCKKWTFYRRQKYCIFRYNTNTIVCEPLFVIDLPACFFGFKVKMWCGRGGDLNIVHSITVISDPWFYKMRGVLNGVQSHKWKLDIECEAICGSIVSLLSNCVKWRDDRHAQHVVYLHLTDRERIVLGCMWCRFIFTFLKIFGWIQEILILGTVYFNL